MKEKTSDPGELISVDLFCLGSVVLVILGILQFVQGILQAIRVYPEPFWIFDRFLSELGHDSQLTAESQRLFTRSIVLLGLSMFPFFYSIARAHAEDLSDQATSFCCCGIASAMGLIGIGVSPYNRYPTLHVISILLWLAPMLFMVMRPLPGMEQRHSGIALAFRRAVVVGTAIYLPGMLLLPILSQSEGSIFIRTVMITQKALVVTSLLWLITLLRLIAIAFIKQITNRQGAAAQNSERN